MMTLTGLRRHDGYERWTRWTDWPMVALAVVFLAVLILPLAEPLTRTESRVLDVANIVIWALFAANYLMLLYLSLDRRQYFRTHLLDLLVVVVPFFRPLRLLRLFVVVASTTRRAGGRIVQQVTVFVVCVAAVVLASSAVIVFDAEKSVPFQDRSIRTLGDAMWWAVSTLTTVGYGDVVPKTALGRMMAVLLMLTGIALVGTVTAAVASWFVNLVRNAASSGQAPILAAEHDLSAQITALAATVERLSGQLAAVRTEIAQAE